MLVVFRQHSLAEDSNSSGSFCMGKGPMGCHRLPPFQLCSPTTPLSPLDCLLMQFPLTSPAQRVLSRLSWGILRSLFPQHGKRWKLKTSKKNMGTKRIWEIVTLKMSYGKPGKSCCYREYTLNLYFCWALTAAGGGRCSIYIFVVLH